MTSYQSERAGIARQGLAVLAARARAWMADHGDLATVQRMAGAAFLIRLSSAAIAFLSQAALARWMGSHEYGIYVYVWTLVLLGGGLSDLGFGTTAQRYIAEYAAPGSASSLRGFLRGSRLMVAAFAAVIGVVGLAALALFSAQIAPHMRWPLALACLCLPPFALVLVQDGIARSFGHVNVALAPPYIVRPLLIIGFVIACRLAGLRDDATLVMACAATATYLTAIAQSLLLNRKLAPMVPAVPRAYACGAWLRASLPVLGVSGFYLLLTYIDLLFLQYFRTPEEVAHYFAAAKTLALVAFIYFSVAAATAHKFAEYHVAGDRERLRAFLRHTVALTFWPSLAGTAAILVLGQPFLWLFGAEFVAAYPAMFILALGLLARASVGPAERLLNMAGEQRRCIAIYAAACLVNALVCVALVPALGLYGAALAMAAGLATESLLLFVVTRRRLGLHCFIWRGAADRAA